MMKTVKEVSRLTGLSVRTLQYYDKIGLLHPDAHTEAGYRLYDDTALEALQQIMLFRELGFPLLQIKEIISDPDFDRSKALEQQITLLTLQKERLEGLIRFARGIRMLGVNDMDFTVFDKSKLEDYAARAKAEWGSTKEYQEMQEKEAGRSPEETDSMLRSFMRLFTEFGGMRTQAPESEPVQKQVARLQAFITENMYTCTDQILQGLGQMYAAGGEFTENIDRAGGEGTALFVSRAIAIFCERKQEFT